MPDANQTPRFAMPLLAAGQAQKEVTHNEALTLIDLALCAQVEAVGGSVPPASPEPGQCWIVGASPGGAWTGEDHALAGWTAGGWRFVQLPVHASVAVRSSGRRWQRGEAGWTAAPSILPPSGGAVVDGECRAALTALVAALTAQGLVAN